MRPTIKVPRLRNYKITVTWPGGMLTSFKMMFAHSTDAVMYAYDKYGFEPKIEVKPA
jgi:hypothetical protein